MSCPCGPRVICKQERHGCTISDDSGRPEHDRSPRPMSLRAGGSVRPPVYSSSKEADFSGRQFGVSSEATTRRPTVTIRRAGRIGCQRKAIFSLRRRQDAPSRPASFRSPLVQTSTKSAYDQPWLRSVFFFLWIARLEKYLPNFLALLLASSSPSGCSGEQGRPPLSLLRPPPPKPNRLRPNGWQTSTCKLPNSFGKTSPQ